MATAPTIVRNQSRTTRRRPERFGKSRSMGPRTQALRDCRHELAPDQRDRVEVLVGEVLEHHALVSDRLDLLQPFERLLDRPDGAALRVALQNLLGLAAEAGPNPPRRLLDLPFVAADDARRHERVAE